MFKILEHARTYELEEYAEEVPISYYNPYATVSVAQLIHATFDYKMLENFDEHYQKNLNDNEKMHKKIKKLSGIIDEIEKTVKSV